MTNGNLDSSISLESSGSFDNVSKPGYVGKTNNAHLIRCIFDLLKEVLCCVRYVVSVCWQPLRYILALSQQICGKRYENQEALKFCCP